MAQAVNKGQTWSVEVVLTNGMEWLDGITSFRIEDGVLVCKRGETTWLFNRWQRARIESEDEPDA